MTRNFTLMMQNDLSDVEQSIASIYFMWFKDEAYSGRQRYDLKTKKWVLGATTPSWKHLTRGGHKTGYPLSRNEFGMRCDWLGEAKNVGEVSKNLVFRRHGKNKRIFVVQRVDKIRFLDKNDVINDCACRQCNGGRKAKSMLTIKDFVWCGTYSEGDR